MKKVYFLMVISVLFITTTARAAIIMDGEFSMWNFGATGTAYVSREESGGNPGACLNIMTVSGPTVCGTAIKADFSTTCPLADTPFELQLDVLSGPGAFGQGQGIFLLVEQNSAVYGIHLGKTYFPLNWDTLSYTGSFTENSFSLFTGTGNATPDFSSGINTYFGFAGSNTNSGTLTQYYDNFSLKIVPIPSALWLFGSALLGFWGIYLRKNA